MSFPPAAPRRRARGALIAAAAALGLGLACAAPASATLDNPDICGDYSNNGQQLMQLLPGIGDGTPGKGFLCTPPVTDMPPFYDYTPDQDAPDPIDPSGAFDSNYAYIIGPNGAAANWTGISTNRIIATAIESVASGVTTAAFVAWAFPPASLAASFGGLVVGATIDVLINVGSQIYDAYEDMAGSDWDVYVPSSSGSGDWHGWIFWDGFGEVQTTTIDPHLVNQYYYNLQDYVDEDPTAYVRLYVGVSQRPVEQGDQIVDDAWNSWVAGNGAFTSVAGRARRRAIGRAGVARVDLARGNQTVHGTAWNDELSARVGNNALDAGAGDDQLAGGPGDDVLLGGSGDDELRAFGGDDQLRGGEGSDLLLGHGGDDVLLGGDGDDVLSDARAGHGGGRGVLDGGAGRDFLIARDGKGDDLLRCGPGDDVVVADRTDRIGRDCELVMTRAPKRGTKPPAMGHPVGRTPGAAQPEWSMERLQQSHRVRSSAGRGRPPHWSPLLASQLRAVTTGR